jgi:hypothetical protein
VTAAQPNADGDRRTAAQDTEALLANWLSRGGDNQGEPAEADFLPGPVAPVTEAGTPQTEDADPDTASQAVTMLEMVFILWSSALSVQVGIDDDFFRLGGGSLEALRTCAQLGRQVGLSVPVRWLFEDRVAAAFAQRVERERERERASRP